MGIRLWRIKYWRVADPPEWTKPTPTETATKAWRTLYAALKTDAEAVID